MTEMGLGIYVGLARPDCLMRRGKGSPALGMYFPASASDNTMPSSSGDFITSCGFLGLTGRTFGNFFLEKKR
jgi:hypothetical protein